jgi:hypothetical protein
MDEFLKIDALAVNAENIDRHPLHPLDNLLADDCIMMLFELVD